MLDFLVHLLGTLTMTGTSSCWKVTGLPFNVEHVAARADVAHLKNVFQTDIFKFDLGAPTKGVSTVT